MKRTIDNRPGFCYVVNDEPVPGGASTWSRDSEDKVLTCKNITKITYGKKELYVRK